jgi:hypothetical protein
LKIRVHALNGETALRVRSDLDCNFIGLASANSAVPDVRLDESDDSEPTIMRKISRTIADQFFTAALPDWEENLLNLMLDDIRFPQHVSRKAATGRGAAQLRFGRRLAFLPVIAVGLTETPRALFQQQPPPYPPCLPS